MVFLKTLLSVNMERSSALCFLAAAVLVIVLRWESHYFPRQVSNTWHK
jgi:hypothetical protein